ncbi:hypothetical protein OGAPHI_007059 [Ogataea philodendri]|uniref:peptidylprolyl isomerase n=1 Tax=Ogataea philodendri TaxID=1378263 RepID=A0A9P8NU96_9ASCO|nr:uncharacterized protein OGAPHI_007059 [Ogataea philodendri]KAH3660473.1 hypothetical protein OGAPHI_007059 [Ogataea philodendri]
MHFYKINLCLFALLAIRAESANEIIADPEFTHQVKFEVQQGDELLGELSLGLFGTIVPDTVKNFFQLSQSEYENTIFHRVIAGFMIQGGDFDGNGGHSIYGTEKGSLPDENFKLNHDRIGRLSMANSGPNTSGSQFFITACPTEFLDGKHVVFGQLIEGFDTLKRIEEVKTDVSDKPLTDVKIVKVESTVLHKNQTYSGQKATIGANVDEQDSVSPVEDSESYEYSDDSDSYIGLESENHGEADSSKIEVQDAEKGDDYMDETAFPDTNSESDTAVSNENESYGYGSQNPHMVLIPFVLFAALLGFVFFKYRSKVLFAIKGPRYRRI